MSELLLPFEYDYMIKAMWVSGLVGATCAFLSAYLMLKGWSLMGDALAHSIVPGVAGAYLLGIPFAAGAFITGFLAAIGMTYPWFRLRFGDWLKLASEGTAQITYLVLGLFTDETKMNDGTAMVFFGNFPVKVIEECTGLYEALLLGAAMLAFPTSWGKIALGFLIGPAPLPPEPGDAEPLEAEQVSTGKAELASPAKHSGHAVQGLHFFVWDEDPREAARWGLELARASGETVESAP